MRQRLLTAAIGIPLTIVVLFFYNTIVLNIGIALVIFGALYEVLLQTHYVQSRALFAICAVFAVAVPFFHIRHFGYMSNVLCYGFMLVLFIYLLANHRTMRLETVATVFLLTLLIAFSLTCIVFIRDSLQYDTQYQRGIFVICLVFIGSWVTDAGGYFAGRFFGKHKLAPEISPKKTVEGVVGGVVLNSMIFLVAALIYTELFLGGARGVTVRYPVLLLWALMSSAVAVLGDLFASLIKRECHIKDFGTIMPGHGGVLDRFDSVLFVAPLLLILSHFLPAVV